MKQLIRYFAATISAALFISCGDPDLSESWAKNKFREETGLISGCTIDSVKIYAGQGCIFATITNEAKTALEERFRFVSNEEFLKTYNTDTINYVPFPIQLYNLDDVDSEYIYHLKTYLRKYPFKGNTTTYYTTSYYVIILSKWKDKVIFTEAFYD